MRSITGVARAHVAHRRGRALMSAIGIVLGVAMYVAVQGANAGLLASFDAQFAGRTGDTDAQLVPLGGDNAVLPADTVSAVGNLPGVVAVSGTLRVAAARADGATVHLSGVDDALRTLVTYEASAGRLPEPGADEVVVAAGSGLGLGDTLDVLTSAGPRSLAVVGLLSDDGVGDLDSSLDDVTVAFTSLEKARELDGRGAVVSLLRIALADGVDPHGWVDEHEDAVQGASARVTEPTGSPLGGFGLGLSIIAYLCLSIGAYLIFVTMSGVVAQRTAELGTLRALGATRRQIRKLVRAEALAMSTLGGLVGVVLGVVLGYLLTVLLARVIGLDDASFAFPASGAVTGFVIGLVVTVIGASLPARRAARLSPVVAMRGAVESRAKTSRGWIAGLGLVPFGVVLSTIGNAFGVVFVTAGAVLLVPPTLGPLTRAVGPVASRLAPGVGGITVLQVLRERARAAGALAVVTVILGAGLGLIMTISAMKSGADRILEATVKADVQVMNPGLLPPASVELVRRTEGVERVSEQWFGRTEVVEAVDEQRFAWLSIIDPSTYFDVAGFDLTSGTLEQVRLGLAAGRAVVVDERLAEELGVSTGDELTLTTTSGPVAFAVAGTFDAGFGFGGQIVASIVDREVFSAGSPGGLLVGVADGADVESVGNAIRRQLHADASFGFGGGRAMVATRDQIVDQVNADVSQQLNIFYGVSAVAALVALLGMANTLGISVLQRRRELGLLRAVGARRTQVSRSVLVESVTLCASAFLLAIPLGYLNGLVLTNRSRDFVGYDVQVQLPVGGAVVILAMTVGIATLAALAPARRAARLPIVDALRVD